MKKVLCGIMTAFMVSALFVTGAKADEPIESKKEEKVVEQNPKTGAFANYAILGALGVGAVTIVLHTNKEKKIHKI